MNSETEDKGLPMTGDEPLLIKDIVRRISALEYVIATVGIHQDYAFYQRQLKRFDTYLRESLFDEMMHLSLVYTGVTWHREMEYLLWGIENHGWSRSLPRNNIPDTGLKRLMALSQAVDGWWYCPSPNSREFVSLEVWKNLFQKKLPPG